MVLTDEDAARLVTLQPPNEGGARPVLDGSTEKPEYPQTPELLYAFCTDGLTDPNAMIRRLNHAERDSNLTKSVVAQVREAIWDRPNTTFHDGTIGQPPATYRGVAWIGRRRSI
jgi:hypothetical protein